MVTDGASLLRPRSVSSGGRTPGRTTSGRVLRSSSDRSSGDKLLSGDAPFSTFVAENSRFSLFSLRRGSECSPTDRHQECPHLWYPVSRNPRGLPPLCSVVVQTHLLTLVLTLPVDLPHPCHRWDVTEDRSWWMSSPSHPDESVPDRDGPKWE